MKKLKISKKKMKKVIKIILIALFIFCIFKIGTNLYEKHKANKLYKTIIEMVVIEEKPSQIEDLMFINVDFSKLLKMNSDTVGWIKYNEISYPVVQYTDNGFYLTKSFDKKNNGFGTIFMDYRNINFNGKNTIIYGHNASNIMFGKLKNLLNKKYFNENGNDIIRISTPHDNYIYQIFSVYVTPKEDYYITTSFSGDSFREFIDNISKRSKHKTDVIVEDEDNILTLSTCNGTFGNKRLVVHAKLIEKEERK